MGDAIKRLFHKRYRSTDKDFKPLQSLPYRDARPGPPPRRGSLPLRGNNTSSSNGPLSAAALRASPTRPRRSASLGSTHSHLRQNRLRKAASDPARKGRPGDLLRSNFTVDGDIPPASPPLPGTALTSDDARYWRDTDGNANPLVRQLSTGAESRYGEDVADRVLAEFFPKPPVGPAGNHDLDSAERASDSSASLSGPLKNAVLRERGSYTLVDGDGFPSLEPSRSNNTQSRLFLDDSDEDSGGASSREHGHKRSPSSLKRKKGHPSGLRNFSNPRNDYSVQEPVRKYNKPDGFANASHATEPTRSYLIEDSPEPPSLDGVVDLRDTEDTTYHSRYAPAVTHQTVFPEVHHIREEQIFREIHTHDVFHRILPIVDVEVLPARHFVPIEEGGLTEIPEEDVPGRTSNSQARNWVVAELVSKRTSDDTPMEPRQFSAREFPGTEGDERRYITEDGFERTETTWVHPPTVETGAKDSGQTEPLYVLPYRPIETQNEDHDVREGNATTQKSLGGLTGGVRSCPFDECAEFEAQGRENGRGSSGQLVGHSVEAAQCNGA